MLIFLITRVKKMININNFKISKDEYFDIKIALFSKKTDDLVIQADLNKYKSFFELLDTLVSKIDAVENLTDLLNNYYLKFTKFPFGFAQVKMEKEIISCVIMSLLKQNNL